MEYFENLSKNMNLEYINCYGVSWNINDYVVHMDGSNGTQGPK